MASLGLHLLTILIGVIFVFLGHIKLTPQFFPEYHDQIKTEFGKLNKEFPFYHLTGWRPYAKHYRMGVGIIEMSSGSLLLLGGSLLQLLANVTLLVIMINMIIAFYTLQYSIEYIGAAIFLAILLVVRLSLASKAGASKPTKTEKSKQESKTK